MLKKGIFLIGLAGLLVVSCNKHEVIPAPEPTVDLESSFEGNVGGSFMEFTENVNGYYPYPNLSSQSSGGTTNAQYRFSMRSDESAQYVEIGLGSLTWSDATGTSSPSLTQFNNFFTDNLIPPYSDGALTTGGVPGFEVIYVGTGGTIFRSSENSVYPQDVEFIEASVVQESDNAGDYSKFTCTFNCYVYHPDSTEDATVVPQTIPPTMIYWTDSILIENAIYKGYFKR